MAKPGLFIGRFQPLHKGHVHALEDAFAEERTLFIVIGSAQACFTPTNPFTTAERIQMLRATLNAIKIPCEQYLIIPIPDIHNFRRWVDHVVQFVPPFGTFYTGSESMQHLFSEKKYPVKMVELYKPGILSGTEIRRRIVKGEDWKTLVPPVVEELIQKFDGVKRIQSLSY
ncbi:MAG: nicotinamide-nucleotide adenylyltransferase [Promethearchaeota archaeon]